MPFQSMDQKKQLSTQDKVQAPKAPMAPIPKQAAAKPIAPKIADKKSPMSMDRRIKATNMILKQKY